jgi:L-fuculose-phosphate aldolase
MEEIKEKEERLRGEIINTGRRLYEQRLVSGRSGNLSARIGKNEFLITATLTNLGKLRQDDIIRVDLSSEAHKQNERLSTEFPLHSHIYESLHNVSRIIHCHPPLTNAYFSLYDTLELLTFETKLFLGSVPIIYQSTPTITDTQKVIDSLKNNNIIVIRNHGAVAIGSNFTEALYLIETLEEAVRMTGLKRLFEKKKLNSFEERLREDLSSPISKDKYEMFSTEHIKAIVDLVNKDKFMAQKGKELDLTLCLAIKLEGEEKKVYKFNFERGKITNLEYDDNASFVISAPANVWQAIFLGKLDPFVATTQGKMKLLKGEFGKLSRWYVPFSRLFELFKEVEIK